jgi:hypothetical protein
MHGVVRRSDAAPPRRRGVAVALLGAVLLHWVFFAGLERPWRAPAAPPQAPVALSVLSVLSVQDLDRAAPAPPVVQVPGPTQLQVPVAQSSRRRARGLGSVEAAPAEPAAAASTADAASPPRLDRVEPAVALPRSVEVAVQQEPRPQASVPAAPAGSEPAASAVHEAVPVYATLIPAPAVLRYRMRRGLLQGSAEIVWRVDAGRYEARLEAGAAGIALLTQVSQGGFDAAGLAPQRFTDKRVRRSSVAANFQRDAGREAGKITFSGTTAETALHDGTQDRLSWMVQLAAIASAGPQLLAAQGRIAMHVVGAHGDAAVWHFLSAGEQNLEGNPAAMRVFKLQRLPETPYDTQVDVWLDALPPHWPVRAHWRNGPQDPGLELWRIDIAEPR